MEHATTSAELLEQIVRYPDDDAPRLAYADLIASQSPAQAERAEFIRLQIERFRDETARGAIDGKPSARETELRRRHGATWGHFIAPYARAYRANAPFQGYEFERGFVALLRTDPDMVADMGDRLVNMAPIQHLDLTREGPLVPALTAPCLGRMRSLGVNTLGLGDDEAIALAERGHLDRCAYLDLAGNKITRRGVDALLANPVIRNMPVVILRGNPGDPSVLVSYDLDGSPLIEGLPHDGEAAEARYGHIPWLHLPQLRVPDRSYARTARPSARAHP